MYTLERLGKETAREYAYRVIKYNIISLELIPGSMVSENELAAWMGISRTPVREALIELSKLKAVEIFPQKGSCISLINSQLVDEARRVRLILEKSIVEMICDRDETIDWYELDENIRMQEYFLQHPKKSKQLELDNEFHELLFKVSNMKFTYSLLSGMMLHFDRVRKLSTMVIKDSKNVSDHIALLQAIKKKDKKSAKDTIAEHLSRYIIDEQVMRKEYPDYFI